MKVKFVWNGIKIDGEFFKGHYSHGPYTATSGLPEGTITIYMNGYKSLPHLPGLSIENGSDTMTDYFETDTVRIFPGSEYYAEADKAMKAHDIHCAKHAVKYYEKLLPRYIGSRHEDMYRGYLEESRKQLEALTA